MSRAFDLIAAIAVAVVLLLPKASLEAHQALVGDELDLDRIAALEDARFAEPDQVNHAVALGDAYLSVEHPDWALETTAQFSGRGDHRIELVRATAHAERLEAEACVATTHRGLAECDAEGPTRCPAADRVRFQMISSAMQVLVDDHIDPRKDPRRAKEAVAGVLHNTHPSSQGPKKK